MPGTDGSIPTAQFLIWLFAALLVAGFGWAAYLVVGSFQGSMPTASLTLSSVLLLLGALLIFGMAVNSAGLSDKTQALGLPEGSVRAILALALVGVFAIMASSVLQGTENHERKDLTQADVNEFKARYPDALSFTVKPQTSGNTTGAVFTLTFDTPKKIDEYAKQVLAVIGTLMTAVVAFYFGSASSRAPADVSRAAPELTTVISAIRDPLKHDVSLSLKLAGASLNSVRKVRLSQSGSELEAESVLSNASEVACTFAANTAFEKPGKWNVTATDDIGRSVTKVEGLTFAVATSTIATPTTAAKPTLETITPGSVALPEAKDKVFTITGKSLSGVAAVGLINNVDQKSCPGIIDASRKETELHCAFPSITEGEWIVQMTITGSTQPETTVLKIAITKT